MSQAVNATTLAGLATQELRAALVAVTAGDDNAAGLAENLGRHLSAVGGATMKTLARASDLQNNDLMNVAGKERLLAALPDDLVAATGDSLYQADVHADLIEARHLAELLRHDGRHDRNLIAELQNWTANLSQGEAAATLAGLAANVRYSTFLAGPMGESLMARHGIKDPEFFRRIALEALAVNGTDEQRKRAAALQEGVPKVRRVIGLYRGSRDATLDEIKRPPAPKPSVL